MEEQEGGGGCGGGCGARPQGDPKVRNEPGGWNSSLLFLHLPLALLCFWEWLGTCWLRPGWVQKARRRRLSGFENQGECRGGEGCSSHM